MYRNSLEKDILTFIGSDYRDALIKILYHYIIQKNFKFFEWPHKPNNDCRVAMHSRFSITITGIIMQSLKSIGQI